MSFSNVYYRRTAGTAKGCYVCYKATTTVLATMNATDFLYTCPTHLSDRGFATIIGMDEEIAKIKEEWEEKQKRKKEKESEKDKEDEKDKEKEKEKEKEKVVPVHERYALHRDFFAMREQEHRKRRQAAQAQALAPRLPGAPRGI